MANPTNICLAGPGPARERETGGVLGNVSRHSLLFLCGWRGGGAARLGLAM